MFALTIKELMAMVIVAVSCVAAAHEGSCGYSCKWEFDRKSGSLVISGKGGITSTEYKDYAPEIIYVKINKGITSIGRSAFSNCPGISAVSLPDSLSLIDGFAFANCGNLTKINLPDSIKVFGEHAFERTRLSNVTIPAGVESLSENLFAYCSDLSSVTIGNSVEYIDNYAFAGCSRLANITIPDSVTQINDYVFYSCSSLSKVLYLGKNDPGKDSKKVFQACARLDKVGVTKDYLDETFCKKDIYIAQ